MSVDEKAMNEVIVYTTETCGPCRRLKRQLVEARVPFREVDVNRAPEVGARIEAATGGYRIVPSVEVGDHLLVNPSVPQVIEVAGSAA